MESKQFDQNSLNGCYAIPNISGSASISLSPWLLQSIHFSENVYAMYLVYRQLVYVYINAHCYHKWTNECICVGALLLCCLALFGDYLCARLERYWENVVGCDCCSIQYICCWMFGVVCGCARLRQELPLFQLISQQYTLFQLSCARARTRNTRERAREIFSFISHWKSVAKKNNE